MNSTEKYGITSEGLVHRWSREKENWERLGHIACIVRQDTITALEVREWWQARLASDERAKNIVLERERCARQRVPETALVISSQPDREPAEVRLAAD